MKFISKKKIATAEMSDRVQREIQYLGMLQHPHIIKLYDVTQTTDSIVMVIEYLKGELFDYIVKTGRVRFWMAVLSCPYSVHRWRNRKLGGSSSRSSPPSSIATRTILSTEI
jgi:serine/threonine protein kinase